MATDDETKLSTTLAPSETAHHTYAELMAHLARLDGSPPSTTHIHEILRLLADLSHSPRLSLTLHAPCATSNQWHWPPQPEHKVSPPLDHHFPIAHDNHLCGSLSAPHHHPILSAAAQLLASLLTPATANPTPTPASTENDTTQRLLGKVAHDFNNIFMVMNGNIELALQDHTADPTTHHCLFEIKRATEHAATLCQRLLDYSGRAPAKKESLSINHALRDWLATFEQHRPRHVNLTLELAPDLPQVSADPALLSKIWRFLCDNALEAIGTNAGNITIATGALTVPHDPHPTGEEEDQAFSHAHLPAGSYVHVDIADSGIGIAPSIRKHIFNPFFSTKAHARGLGLPATLTLLRRLSGTLLIHSQPGEGATFRVVLPALTQRPERRDPLPTSAPTTYPSGAVLLVDDDPSIRALGQRMLEKLGFQTLLAADGREALTIFRHRFREIACVILDLSMPRLDGEATLAELQHIHPTTPVILSSGHTENDIGQRFAGKGLAAFIQKPYTIQNLNEALEKATTPVHP